MRHLNDVSLASRWWPVLVAGYRFHRNTVTDPIPLLKKINSSKLWTWTPLRKLSVSAQVKISDTFKKYDKVFGMTL